MDIANEKLGAAGSLVVAIVANHMDREESWPFVTLSAFQERTKTIMKLSRVLSIGVNPLVTRENRAKWEEYSNYDSEAAFWYKEGMEYNRKKGIDQFDVCRQIVPGDPTLNVLMGIANRIFNQDYQAGKALSSPDADWHLPMWQVSEICANVSSSLIPMRTANNPFFLGT